MLNFLHETHVTDRERDRLGFGKQVSLLASAVRIAKPPFTIGVFGEWGTGKTSLISLARQELQEDSTEVLTVWLDTWKYGDVSNLLIPLAYAIEKAAKDNSSTRKSLKKAGQVAAKVLTANVGAMLKVALKERTGIDVSMETASDLSPDKIDNWVSDVDDIESQFRELVATVLKETKKKRICVFVDDLDRCSPEVSLRLLESTRIFFHHTDIVFVVALSPETIIQGVRSKYGDNPRLANDYAQKLVHYWISVPLCTSSYRELLQHLLAEINPALTGAPVAFAKSVVEATQVGRVKNIRLIKQMVSRAVFFALANEELVNGPMGKELAYLLVCKHAFPTIYGLAQARIQFLSYAVNAINPDDVSGRDSNRKVMSDAEIHAVDSPGAPYEFLVKLSGAAEAEKSFVRSAAGREAFSSISDLL